MTERATPPRTPEDWATRVLIADRLREALWQRRSSGRKLALQIGRPSSFISAIERKLRRVSVADVWQIAVALKQSPDWFMGAPRDPDEQAAWDHAIVQFKTNTWEFTGPGREASTDD